MTEYTVLYEQGPESWGAIVPDLPGCVSVGGTLEEVRENVREAIEVYLEVIAERGEPIPSPRHRSGTVAVAVRSRGGRAEA